MIAYWCNTKSRFGFRRQLLFKRSKVEEKTNKNVLTPYKTDLKHVVAISLYQGYCLKCIYSCIKFYCPKLKEY